MKKRLSILLAVLLLLSCMLTALPAVQAEKATEKRAIAIVYDNSGSMYVDQNKAWCRATYAIEVFASMLNEGDILQIYPMNPFTLGENGDIVFSMQNPLVITNASDAYKIRDNFINEDGNTPIETIDAAAEGLKKVSADKKYLIIITDGAVFHTQMKDENGNLKFRPDGKPAYGYIKDYKGYENDPNGATKVGLEERIKKYAGTEMTVMYLGMDTDGTSTKACNPFSETTEKDAPENNYVEKIAKKSLDVISSLTDLCNIIFGRDTLPEKYFLDGGKIDLQVSTKKLIVFVQGTNIKDLKVTGPGIGEKVGVTKHTKYAENGNGWATFQPIASDTDLQGMMVTYKGSSAGIFTIECDGTAESIEVYYEPDVEMMFKFLDATTEKPVDPKKLYEGDYLLQYGMIDAKSGEFVESDILGMPEYTGSYTVSDADGENPETITLGPEKGFKGEQRISLKMDEKFEAELEVEYLSGYRIKKTSDDFGWGEIIIRPKTVEGYRLEIKGGDGSYPLQQLGKEGAPYKAEVYYENKLLKGEELKKVDLRWEPEKSNAEIKKEFKEDHWELTLHHKDLNAPQNTKCGECSVTIYAYYTPPQSKETWADAELTYNIKDDSADLGVKLDISDDYIVIKDMAEAQPIIVNFTLNGAPVTAEDFKKIELIPPIDCGGIKYEEPVRDEASLTYKIKLLKTDNLKEGNYTIKVKAKYTDSIGRVTEDEDESLITLSSLPLWVKWVITISILLILFIIIWTILHIRVLPTKAHTTKKLSFMVYDSDDVTRSANFLAEIKQGGAKFQTQYGGRKYGITMEVAPGKESYLYKGQKRRSAEVSVASVRKFGPAKIQEAMIGSAKYVLDDDTGKLVPALPNMKPFPIKNGMMVKFSGSIQDAGVDKDFEVTSKINFKK